MGTHGFAPRLIPPSSEDEGFLRIFYELRPLARQRPHGPRLRRPLRRHHQLDDGERRKVRNVVQQLPEWTVYLAHLFGSQRGLDQQLHRQVQGQGADAAPQHLGYRPHHEGRQGHRRRRDERAVGFSGSLLHAHKQAHAYRPGRLRNCRVSTARARPVQYGANRTGRGPRAPAVPSTQHSRSSPP